MAHWNPDTHQIEYYEPQKVTDYPGWLRSDCGCCHGIKWGGEEPEECDDCSGSGWIWKHEASGALAAWPGGPFLGKG